MSLLLSGDLRLSKSQIIPAVLGEPFGGGYFAGYISHTADGNPTHALIVAPRATGATGNDYTLTTNLAWKTAGTTTTNTTSTFDGAANTAAMVTAGIVDHPAAEFCVNLSIGGFADWYLPSRYEFDIAYFNLKPGTQANNTGAGINIYAVPPVNANWITTYPAQTQLDLFKTGGSQAFGVSTHWASTQTASNTAWTLRPQDGVQGPVSKSTALNLRAFRRIAL